MVLNCDTAAAAAELYLQLQQAVAQRTAAGLAAPRDLGAAIASPLGSSSVFGGSVQMRPGRAGVAAAARADLLLSKEEEEEADDSNSPAFSAQGSAALEAAADLEDGPRCVCLGSW